MNDVNPHASHRWFQISLRSLFLLTLLVAVYFAGYRSGVREKDRAVFAERYRGALPDRAARVSALGQRQTEMEQVFLENRLLRIELGDKLTKSLESDIERGMGPRKRPQTP